MLTVMGSQPRLVVALPNELHPHQHNSNLQQPSSPSAINTDSPLRLSNHHQHYDLNLAGLSVAHPIQLPNASYAIRLPASQGFIMSPTTIRPHYQQQQPGQPLAQLIPPQTHTLYPPGSTHAFHIANQNSKLQNTGNLKAFPCKQILADNNNFRISRGSHRCSTLECGHLSDTESHNFSSPPPLPEYRSHQETDQNMTSESNHLAINKNFDIRTNYGESTHFDVRKYRDTIQRNISSPSMRIDIGSRSGKEAETSYPYSQSMSDNTLTQNSLSKHKVEASSSLCVKSNSHHTENRIRPDITGVSNTNPKMITDFTKNDDTSESSESEATVKFDVSSDYIETSSCRNNTFHSCNNKRRSDENCFNGMEVMVKRKRTNVEHDNKLRTRVDKLPHSIAAILDMKELTPNCNMDTVDNDEDIDNITISSNMIKRLESGEFEARNISNGISSDNNDNDRCEDEHDLSVSGSHKNEYNDDFSVCDDIDNDIDEIDFDDDVIDSDKKYTSETNVKIAFMRKPSPNQRHRFDDNDDGLEVIEESRNIVPNDSSSCEEHIEIDFHDDENEVKKDDGVGDYYRDDESPDDKSCKSNFVLDSFQNENYYEKVSTRDQKQGCEKHTGSPPGTTAVFMTGRTKQCISHLKKLEDLILKNEERHLKNDEFFKATTQILHAYEIPMENNGTTEPNTRNDIRIEPKDVLTGVKHNIQFSENSSCSDCSPSQQNQDETDYIKTSIRTTTPKFIDASSHSSTIDQQSYNNFEFLPKSSSKISYKRHIDAGKQNDEHCDNSQPVTINSNEKGLNVTNINRSEFDRLPGIHNSRASFLPHYDNSIKSAFKPIMKDDPRPPFSALPIPLIHNLLNHKHFSREQNFYMDKILKPPPYIPNKNLLPDNVNISPLQDNISQAQLDAIFMLRDQPPPLLLNKQSLNCDSPPAAGPPTIFKTPPANQINAWFNILHRRYYSSPVLKSNDIHNDSFPSDSFPSSSQRNAQSIQTVSSLKKQNSNNNTNNNNNYNIAPRYHCESCNKTYSTFGGLSKHRQFHCLQHVKKDFACKFCTKSYSSLGALKMHIRTHTLPCKCHVCGKAFSRPWLLQGHVRTHTGERPFQCQQCGRAFADRSNLRAHLQTHAHIKKYACEKCGKTFSRMSLLNKHSDGSCPANVMSCL